MPADPAADTWTGAAGATSARRPRERTVREPAAGALRVEPLALGALVASAAVLACVLVAVGFAMGRATRVTAATVTCRCAP